MATDHMSIAREQLKDLEKFSQTFEVTFTSAGDFPNFGDTHRLAIVKFKQPIDNSERVQKFFITNETMQRIIALIGYNTP